MVVRNVMAIVLVASGAALFFILGLGGIAVKNAGTGMLGPLLYGE